MPKALWEKQKYFHFDVNYNDNKLCTEVTNMQYPTPFWSLTMFTYRKINHAKPPSH